MAEARASTARRAGYLDPRMALICQVMTTANTSSPASSSATVEASIAPPTGTV